MACGHWQRPEPRFLRLCRELAPRGPKLQVKPDRDAASSSCAPTPSRRGPVSDAELSRGQCHGHGDRGCQWVAGIKWPLLSGSFASLEWVSFKLVLSLLVLPLSTTDVASGLYGGDNVPVRSLAGTRPGRPPAARAGAPPAGWAAKGTWGHTSR
jgi:hypothetical protein